MADNYGVWTGVGQGLGQFGQALAYRGQKLEADREKQADKFETDARNIAANIAELGGPTAPGAADLVQQLHQTVTMHNALYPPHETPALIARIERFLGKTPGPPQQDIRAQMTPESVMASTLPLSQAASKKTLMEERGEFLQTFTAMHPELPREEQIKQGDALFQKLKMERAGSTKDRRYLMPDGTIRVVSSDNQEAIDALENAGATPLLYASQLRGHHTEDQIKNAAHMFANWGKIQPEYEVEVSDYLQNHPEIHVVDKNMVRAWGKEPDPDGRYYSFLVNKYTNVPELGSKRYDAGLPPAAYLPQVVPGVEFYVDNQNQRHMVTYEKTQQRQVPTGTGPAAAPAGAPPAVPQAAPPAVPGAQPPGGAAQVAPLAAPAAAQGKGPAPKAGTTQVTGDVVIGSEKLPAAIQQNMQRAHMVTEISGPALINKIERLRGYLGPIHGNVQRGKLAVGYGNPEVRGLQADMASFAALQPGFHGARGLGAIRAFEDISGKINEQPDNAIAAIRALMDQSRAFLKTGGQEVDDPNLMWVQVPGHPPGQIDAAQWEQFKKDNPNGVQVQAPQQ